ncbi:MAG: replication-associated recombination protein A, partial [Myxococcota bacterium]
PLRRLIQSGELPSMILWGPPGVGKTTLAHVLAGALSAQVETLSAVMAGVKDIRAVVDRARRSWAERRQRTLLFVDEIHRFNKAQQDALLPHVENGLATLIGATTENPSFEVNAALLSRVKVFVLNGIDPEALEALLDRALTSEVGLGNRKLAIDADAKRAIAEHSQGDARRALNALEPAADLAAQAGESSIALARVEEALQHKALLYDKAGEEHYNVISVFIKSMRGSDPDAAVYWMTRMLESGEDPRFILRRMVIFASEDVGNADPRALSVATDALRAFELVGLPEGALVLSQAATYLASAPKSNASYKAYTLAREDVRSRGALPVPERFRNARTTLAKELGYGAGYQYPHDFEGHYVVEEYLPDALHGRRYYDPPESGYERTIRERLDYLREQ